jgi:hypothetical protein
MTTQRRAIRFLLLFTLLAGQWLYVTHTHDHDAFESNHVCQMCLHAVQFDSFLPASDLQKLTSSSLRLITLLDFSPHTAGNVRFHDSRAPPPRS